MGWFRTLLWLSLLMVGANNYSPLPALAQEDPLYQEGLKYLQSGQHQQAVEVLERASRLNPVNIPTLQALAEAYLHLNQLPLAQATLVAARQLNRDLPRTHFLLGRLRLQEGAPDKALSEFRTVLYLGAGDAETYYHLARAYFLLQQKPQGLEALQQALALPDLAGDTKARLFVLLAENEETQEKAMEHIHQALTAAQQPQLKEEIRFQQVQLLAKMGRVDELMDIYFLLFDQAAAQKDVQAERKYFAHFWQTLGPQASDYLPEFIHKLDSLYEKYPEDSLLRQQLIQAYTKTGQLEYVQTLYQHELISNGARLSPEDQATLLQQIADIQLQRGYLQFAYDNYKRAVEKNPKNTEAATKMGLLLLSNGEYKGAIKQFETLLKEEPLSEKFKLYLAYAYLFDNQPDQAAKYQSHFKGEKWQERWLFALILHKKGKPMPDLWKMLLEDIP